MIKGYIQILLASLMLGVPVYSHALTISGGNSYSTSTGTDIRFSFRVDVDDAYTWGEGLNKPEFTNVSYDLWHGASRYSFSDNIFSRLSFYESFTDTGTVFADSDTDSWSFLGAIPITSSLGWALLADQDQITVFGETSSATGDGFFLRDYEESLAELTPPWLLVPFDPNFTFPVIPPGQFTVYLASVPEPSAFFLMGLGLLGLRFSRQR